MTAAARRAAVSYARVHYAGLSERRACRHVGTALSSQRYRSVRPPAIELRTRLRELAEDRIRWGYRRLHILLAREGQHVNHKRVYRIYREEGLAVRRRKRKRVAVPRAPMVTPRAINECWAMDFMSDVLRGGRRFRVFNVVDALSREGIVNTVDTSLPSLRVIRALDEVALGRGYPSRVICDNGPEFRSRAFDQWAYEHGVRIEFIQPGKPIQNAMSESFNGRMRDECLNLHWWRTIEEARRAIRRWVEDYNTVRPHSALDGRTPAEFVRSYEAALNRQMLHTAAVAVTG